MKPFPLLRRLVTGALILMVAAGSAALTLGRSQGVALIGRPLNVGIALELDPGTDPSGVCLEADVFYGDTSVDPARITARLESVQGNNAMARVRSPVPVDEPVVTVYLKVGCNQRITRRYVLLSEQPGDEPAMPLRLPSISVPATVQPAAPVTTPESRRAARAAAAAAGRSAAANPDAPPRAAAAPASPADAPAGTAPAWARSQAAAARAEARAARRAAAAEAAAAKPAAAATPRPPTRAAAARERAQLKLEPLDLSIERNPTLRFTDTISGGPEGDPQRRAEAQLLWQALNASPEDILRNTQRIQGLEGDIKSLRDAVTKNNASLADLRSQVDVARSERYANPLVYALLGLLLAAVAAAVYAFRRGSTWTAPDQGKGNDWWSGGKGEVADSDFGPEFVPPPPSPKSRPVPMAPRDSQMDSGAIDLDLRFTESALDSLQSKSPSLSSDLTFARSNPGGPDSDFQNSQPPSMRAVKAEEVHDIQQQADFFVSLGEFERAIEVLRSHINLFPGTSAVAWLDLLEIYHKLQRREDYEATRQEFHDAFNAEAPSFDNYQEQSEGLEGYPAALSRIVALWPSPKVLEIIEESIFRKPGQAGGEPFGLRAYRELLMLYNIGKDVIEAGHSMMDFETSSTPPSDFSHTSIQPLSAVKAAAPAGRPELADMPAIEAPEIGLDINLDDPGIDAELEELMPMGTEDDRTRPVEKSNLLDFDLPDVDLDAFTIKKPPDRDSF